VNNAVSIVGPTQLGNAGSISLTTPGSLVLAAGGEISTNSTGDGIGGKISLQARQVELSNGATISAESSGRGNAGDIVITAGDTFRSAFSAVTTAADQAGGAGLNCTPGG
jgi:large exoprotein involved in heme utilization and adhesion